MAIETRRITFTPEELLLALTHQRRDERRPLPESRIRGMQVENGGTPRIAIMIEPLAGGAPEPLDLRPAEVAAALIRYCHRCKIPLPKRANKSIAVEHGQVSLVLQLGL